MDALEKAIASGTGTVCEWMRVNVDEEHAEFIIFDEKTRHSFRLFANPEFVSQIITLLSGYMAQFDDGRGYG